MLGAWPASKKVIDVALHKFLSAEGERRVRAVDDDDADGDAYDMDYADDDDYFDDCPDDAGWDD